MTGSILPLIYILLICNFLAPRSLPDREYYLYDDHDSGILTGSTRSALRART